MNTKAKSNGAWQACAPMKEARSHFASAVYDGRIFCFGGGGVDFKSLNSVECYNPEKDSWQPMSGMPTIRSGIGAAVLGDKIYVVGGGFKNEDGRFTYFKTVEIYDPVSDSWEAGPDMLMPHDYPAVISLEDRLFVLGGHHPDCQGGPLSDPGFEFCESLNAGSQAWQNCPGLNSPRFALCAVAIGTTLYAIGGCAKKSEGFFNLPVVERLDKNADNWSMDNRLTLPWNGAGAGACVKNNRLYIFGGNTGETIEASVAYFNFEASCWIRLADMDQPRIAMGAHVVNDSIFIIGGKKSDKKTPIKSVIRLDT